MTDSPWTTGCKLLFLELVVQGLIQPMGQGTEGGSPVGGKLGLIQETHLSDANKAGVA